MPWVASLPVPVAKAARFVDQSPDDPFWRLLHRLADAQVPAMLQDVADALASAGSAIDRGELARFLQSGLAVEAEAVVQRAWEDVGLRGLQETLVPRLIQLALDAAEATPLIGIRVRFNVQDHEALQAIQQYAGNQIVAISETTREAVRGIVQRAFESGTPLTQQIDEIASTVGVTPKQAESVRRYREGLIEAGAKPGRVQELVARRGEALRRQRAEAISRTESINAVSRGNFERLQQSIRSGLVDGSRVRRFWVPALDARTCPICSQIPSRNPEGRGVNEPFESSVGPIMYPTAHVMCRCTISLTVEAG